MANLELTDSIIGVLGKNETEKTVAQILTTLENRGDIEGSGLRSEVTITGFNFGESNTVSVGTTEETKTKNLTANFISPEIAGAYYVLIEGKKYPISKINGRIKIEKTEIQSNDNTSAKISNVVSNDTDIATIEKTGDKQITIIGKARGNTTVTVQSTGLPDVTLNVNVKGSTTITINSDTIGCQVTPSGDVVAQEGETLTIEIETIAVGKEFKGWYIGSEESPRSTGERYDLLIPKDNVYVESIIVTAKFEEKTSEIPKGRTDRVKYGGYVENYNVNLSLGGNSTRLASVSDDWRILYDDGTNIYIIASDCVPVSNSYLATAMTKMGAYSRGKDYPVNVRWSTSGTTFKDYQSGNSPILATGAADIFTNRPEGTAYLDGRGMLGFWKAQTTTSESIGAKMTASLMDTKVWEGFAEGLPSGVNGTAYAIGGPTLSMWVESWNVLHPNDKIYYNNVNEYGYYIGISSTPTTTFLRDEIRSMTGYSDGFLFRASGSNNYAYWLSSPSAEGAVDDGTFHVNDSQNGGYIGDSAPSWSGCGVRPVVCLPSTVQLTETAEGSKLYTISNKTTTE